jgi:hypothetical protein
LLFHHSNPITNMANRFFSSSLQIFASVRGLFLGLALLLGASQISAQTIYALSGNNLISFRATAPATLLSNVAITGIPASMSIAGLDFRPNTGQLYAMGYNQGSGMARLYTIDLNSGAASAIGAAAITLNANMGKVTVDFNPIVDRIRVTGSDNSNYRLHPVTGALVATDGNLAYAAADANAGQDPSISTGAYTNSYIGSTSTTLYNYDDALNILTTQIPPNDGVLNTIGTSGITVNTASPASDFDIYFDATSGTNRAFLAANSGTQTTSSLYMLNLSSGAATLIGAIGNGQSVSNIAVLIDRTVPASVSGQLTYALTSNGNLISFDAAMPGVIRSLATVTGIAMGQALSGLDIRPATGELYTIGYNASSGEAQLYTLNPANGAATAIGAAPLMLNPNMGKITLDFNPTVDRIRLTGSNNSNYRLHPVTGALAATDGNLRFANGDVNAGIDPSIGTGAYTNSFGGATMTTLYNYDDSLNILTTQIPPNDGVLNTIGSSGITVNLADPSTDLDIFFSQYGAPNRAYLAANVGSSTFDNLYTVNLMTGAATMVGRIGNGIAITDIAITGQASETACDAKTAGCLDYELLSITKNTSGDKTYRVRITNNCPEKLVYAAFQLPKGVTEVSMANNSTYNSPAGKAYTVRNPNFSPFYSVRFMEQSTDGIANGQSDLFEYTLPSTANPTFIHVLTRTGNTSRQAYINVFDCTVASSVSRPEADEREFGLSILGEVRVFPNPTEGTVFADLSAWDDQQVQIRVFSAQGQTVLQETAQGGQIHRMELPGTLPVGMYLLEMSNERGEQQVQKLVVRR